MAFNAAAVQAAPGSVPDAQLLPALFALEACTAIASAAPATPRQIYVVASAACLLFGAGHRAVQELLAGRPERWAGTLAGTQLSAARWVMNVLLNTSERPCEAAAFAGSTGRPEVLLPWLVQQARALSARAGARGGVCLGATEASLLAGIIHVLVARPAFGRHAAALGADAALSQPVADCLLQHCLGVLAGKAAADLRCLLKPGEPMRLLHDLAGTLLAHALQPAAQRCLQRADGSVAVRHAVAMLRALPLSRPDGVAPETFSDVHVGAIVLLGCLNQALDPRAAVSSSGLDGSSSGGSSSTGASCRDGSRELARVVPAAAAAVRALADDNECRPSVAAACTGLVMMLSPLLNMQVTTAEQLGDWEAVLEAAVRLQPLLSQLQDEHASSGDYAQLSEVQLECLCCLTHVYRPLGEGTSSGSVLAAGEGRRLWQLHSACARLAHWLAADPGQRRLAASRAQPGYGLRRLAASLDTVAAAMFRTSFCVLLPGSEAGGPDSRQEQESDNACDQPINPCRLPTFPSPAGPRPPTALQAHAGPDCAALAGAAGARCRCRGSRRKPAYWRPAPR